MAAGNPFENSSSSLSPSTPGSGGVLKREKRAVAIYLKDESSKSNNMKPLNDHLDNILDPRKAIDDYDNLDFCKWIISGGLTFDEFGKKVREYDSSVMCGLVWTAKFVAYRCRTCGISPCMSICADCFQAGNHEGHDYNMFRSQAGGACDCGDSNVMKPEGFCPRHGENRENKSSPEAPAELIAVAKIMVPRLFLRLLYHLREQFVSQVRLSRPSFMLNVNDMEQFLAFMQSLSDMGAAMRRIMALALTDEAQYKKSTESSSEKDNSYEHQIYEVYKEQLKINCIRYPPNFDKYKGVSGMDQNLEYKTIIEELMFWVLRFEFPQRLVTFLLGLLPDDLYKEAFAKAFVKHYSRITIVLTDARERSSVANRIVHISVQLFSNRDLAVHLAEEHNLLLTIILSLANMIQNIRIESMLEDPDTKNNFHSVVNCEDPIMKDHCYWPVVSDLINVLSHRQIAHKFLTDADLMASWLDLLNDMQGMNLNTREMTHHVEFEPDTYYAAFSAELEISASPMWSLLMHCQTPDTRQFIIEMIGIAVAALQDWFDAINFKEGMKPNPYQLTFHIPLHRYLATFIMTAVKSHDVDLQSLLPDDSMLKKIMMHALQIQVCLAQIYAGMWVRNGIQIKGQAMTYIQCHFCYSMADADLYLLQLCITKLDPDFFVQTVLERFHILNWLSYSPEPSNIGISMDSDHELAMVEGVLSLLSTLMGMHTYLGISESDLLRKEMASLLCMNDRQHSTLMDLMPEKTGVNGLAKELFEPTLKELADYIAPNFEVIGGLQQGSYQPKSSVWEDDFDPIHVSQRAIYRRDMQAAMDRYTEFLRAKKNFKKKTTPWPPFKIHDKIHHAYTGIYRLLNCRAMHAFLFTVLHKALNKDKSLPEAILFHTVHLLDMCLHFAPKTFPNRTPGLSLSVHDGQLEKWFGTSDIKANACDIISDVIVSTPVTERELVASRSSADDMDTSSLEEMFQIQPSSVISSGGPITAAQVGDIPPLTMVSLPAVACGSPGGPSVNFALGIPTPHPPLGSRQVGKRYESRGVATTQYTTKRITINESLISLLIKLHTKLGGGPSYKPTSEAPSEEAGDGLFYISRFLNRLYAASSNASRVIDETCRSLNMTKVKAGPSDTEKDTKRRKAWNRQQKLMAEFASKQKAFMEQAMEEESADLGETADLGSTSEEQSESIKTKEYDCVICNQTSPSTEQRPVGLVVFLQASSVLGQRHQNDQVYSLDLPESLFQKYLNAACGKVQRRKLELLTKHFEEKSCELSVNIGWEGGIVAQTCGHYLHLDCHRSYLDSLRTQNHAEVLAVNKREYWCPLCRQLSNSVIPMVPEESRTMLVKPVSRDPRQMVADIAEMMVKRRIGEGNTPLTKAMGTVMEDLTNITYPSYRTFSSKYSPESLLLFISSVARINLEVELLLRGGTLEGKNAAQAASPAKKACFLPLIHVLGLHSKILVTSTSYPDLWAHITGTSLSEESSSLSLYKRKVPVLLKDACSLLIQFTLTLSFAIEPGHLDFVVQMLYNLVFVQSLIFVSCKFSSDEREAWRRKGRQSQTTSLEGLLSNIISWLSRSCLYEEIDNSHTLPAICQSVWSPQTVEQTVEEYILPFLRVAALLKSHFYSMDISASEGRSEFEHLSTFLNLGSFMTDDISDKQSPKITTCVQWIVEEPHTLVRAWCVDIAQFINAAPPDAKALLQISPTWQKPSLITLPKRYYQIFQMYRTTKCMVCNKTPKDPAICLVCGQFLCFRDICCANKSTFESVAHSIECGAGTGMFLLVNSSTVVVIRGPRAMLWGSVYLDEHGEEDKDLKRGKPLYLSIARYKLLESMWLSHSFDHSCKRWIWHRDQL